MVSNQATICWWQWNREITEPQVCSEISCFMRIQKDFLKFSVCSWILKGLLSSFNESSSQKEKERETLFSSDHTTRHATVNQVSLIYWLVGQITGITGSPNKNKHHLQSDESDWDPSPWSISQLFLRWTLWKCGNLHKPADFFLFREEYQQLCWWAQMQ
jgi:hypothetical protein